jgi:hypothetical protein
MHGRIYASLSSSRTIFEFLALAVRDWPTDVANLSVSAPYVHYGTSRPTSVRPPQQKLVQSYFLTAKSTQSMTSTCPLIPVQAPLELEAIFSRQDMCYCVVTKSRIRVFSTKCSTLSSVKTFPSVAWSKRLLLPSQELSISATDILPARASRNSFAVGSGTSASPAAYLRDVRSVIPRSLAAPI